MKKIRYSEITPENIYKNRRSFIKSISLSAGSIAMTSFLSVNDALSQEEKNIPATKISRPTTIIMSSELLRVIHI